MEVQRKPRPGPRFARKARLVVDAVRGKRVLEAQADAAVHAEQDRVRARTADEVGRGECGEQLRPRSGRSLDQGDLRR